MKLVMEFFNCIFDENVQIFFVTRVLTCFFPFSINPSLLPFLPCGAVLYIHVSGPVCTSVVSPW